MPCCLPTAWHLSPPEDPYLVHGGDVLQLSVTPTAGQQSPVGGKGTKRSLNHQHLLSTYCMQSGSSVLECPGQPAPGLLSVWASRTPSEALPFWRSRPPAVLARPLWVGLGVGYLQERRGLSVPGLC